MQAALAVGARDAAEPRKFRNPQDGYLHVQIMQGDSYVTAAPDEILTTILGSCIAACIRDPVAQLGGMNHFLLPEGSGSERDAQRFGVNAMELLINGILRHGGARGRLEAKLFGGANVIAALSDVGSRNAAFARQFLAEEGIPVVGGSVGGVAPRRVQFWPVTGRARQLSMPVDVKTLVASELSQAKPAPSASDVELF